ncbi:hypothetical protein [Streptomyces meridianus]|uniref:Uncharacterized protein n=1 Tax=Streptomyces meridianus TaxID=2938945 RepID=A0ABT0XAZ2_9ACTN|nr:hypothetical protein [Streptomyces meridianus]MCM2579685.1 hypothetical protein [Streptomyces meridianus]
MQLENLPADAAQNRWGHQLGILHAALDRLDTLHQEWMGRRERLPAGDRPGTPAFEDALAEHHATCWRCLEDWARHGHVLRDINSAARRASSLLARLQRPRQLTQLDHLGEQASGRRGSESGALRRPASEHGRTR